MIKALFRSVKSLLDEIRRNDLNFYENIVPGKIRERYSSDENDCISLKDYKKMPMTSILSEGYMLKVLLEKSGSLKNIGNEQIDEMERVFFNNIII